MKTARCLALVVIASTSLPAIARAQDENPAALAGTWKRDGEPARMLKLDYDAASGELKGTFLNPPEDPDTKKPFGIDVHLTVKGKKVEGHAKWSEENPNKGKPGQPDNFTTEARWELSTEGPDKLVGRSEWIDWRPNGEVVGKDWEPHSFERVKAVSLGEGAAPEKVEAGQPVDAAALAGGWRTTRGWIVTIKPQESGWVLERVKGEGDFPTAVRLANEGNVLKGLASWSGGAQTSVELALKGPGKLEGRTEKLEGETKSWCGLSLERLPRVDGAADPSAPEPPALADGDSHMFPVLVLKRDDGLYLKLKGEPSSMTYEGDLVTKTGEVKAHVTLGFMHDSNSNEAKGTATFKVDGIAVEARWIMSVMKDGSAESRCEWLDWDPSSKTAVARGFVARKWKAIKTVG